MDTKNRSTVELSLPDLTGTAPAEALKLARIENELIVNVLQTLEATKQGKDGEQMIALSRSESLLVHRSLLAEMQLNNAIIELASAAIKGTN